MNDDALTKFMFQPWMADVRQRKRARSLDKYALAPQEPSHLRGSWRLIFYAELRKHLLETSPEEYQAIQSELELRYAGEGEQLVLFILH